MAWSDQRLSMKQVVNSTFGQTLRIAVGNLAVSITGIFRVINNDDFLGEARVHGQVYELRALAADLQGLAIARGTRLLIDGNHYKALEPPQDDASGMADLIVQEVRP